MIQIYVPRPCCGWLIVGLRRQSGISVYLGSLSCLVNYIIPGGMTGGSVTGQGVTRKPAASNTKGMCYMTMFTTFISLVYGLAGVCYVPCRMYAPQARATRTGN